MYFIKELDNGINVVIEKLDNINSISLGIIVENGSINENDNNNGISHFIEHMLFRGTDNKTAKEISQIIDKIGGNLNAFTSKENTCFYAQVLREHLDIVIELFSDMFLNSLFNEEDIEKEKMIIEEEINMYLDDPEDLVHELLNEMIYFNTSLSLSILGNIDSIKRFNKKDLNNYFNKYYNPKKIIISIAGNLNINETYKKLNQYFGKFNIQNKSEDIKFDTDDIIHGNKIKGIKKDIEQFNLCIGLLGISSSSDDLYSYLILNNILANNESSRLYQSIREAGLAYSLYSSITTYKDIGDMSIYIGLNNNKIENTLSLIDKELNILKNNYIKHEELETCKEQLKINYILENESSLSKMFENAKSISLFKKIETEDQVLKKIDKINKKDMISIINKVFKRETFKIAYISNLEDKAGIEEHIKNKIFRGE
ncbi:M16 family metallopeptidase [Tissierella creatinophila]|uniref:Protease 3 n=1 Tax=Tissierella creatinophila DSM 6911 TaxID=1123403 RepID=A0A1U7M3E7_TISCR|nr:pitrilysin family protein [Tissierella creatinophila]OLS01770.1 protease 3 precursor [Tissierella creatinophila DSM 6911]